MGEQNRRGEGGWGEEGGLSVVNKSADLLPAHAHRVHRMCLDIIRLNEKGVKFATIARPRKMRLS